MARACGKTNIHSLEPEDLAALTMKPLPWPWFLAGTQYTVGRPDMIGEVLSECRMLDAGCWLAT
jgi:hypothetical protein